MERILKRALFAAILGELLILRTGPLYCQTSSISNPELERKIQGVFEQLPPIQQHFVNLAETQAAERREQEQNHRKLSLEKKKGEWAAALVEENTLGIINRFETIQGLL